MDKIKLSKGKFALIDSKDFEWLNQFKWFCNAYGYAALLARKWALRLAIQGGNILGR